jgi:glycosyltransferase involved in cell wall biosynthesis
MNISVVINTKNAAATLERTLKSVSWADELVVMDMKSTDQTTQIAEKYGAHVYSHPDVGYVEPARNAAIQKAKGNWILLVDADEEVPSTLAEKVALLVNGDATADAYYIPRKNIVFNHWYQHAGWWPDYQLRLFKRGMVEWSDKIHQIPAIKGSHDYLAATEEHALIHHNYQTVEQFIDRLNRYTSHEVTSRTTPVNTKAQPSTRTLIYAFKDELLARLFKHRGIDGGLHGVSLSLLQGMYEVIVILKQWQANDFPPQPNQQHQTIAALRGLQADLSYWIADWQVEHSSGLIKWWWRLRRRFKI